MELTSQQTLPVAQAQAWAALNDTEMLKTSITGCESLTPVGPEGSGEYEVLLAVAIGPVKAMLLGLDIGRLSEVLTAALDDDTPGVSVRDLLVRHAEEHNIPV